jgi:transcriptional regulator with XRE-family HTH domain
MAPEYKPSLGFTQPESGLNLRLACFRMPASRESKKSRPPTAIRKVLGRNVVKLRDFVFRDLPHATARNERLAKAIGCSTSQMQRICDGKVGTSVDYVEWLAIALGVSPHDLLNPQFQFRKDAPRSSGENDDRPDDDAPLQRPFHRRPA